MDRREFIRLSGLGALGVVFGSSGCQSEDCLLKSEPSSKKNRPNILWISVEDMSCDLGCYGDSYSVTPNIDRLATEGTRFTNVFTTAGVCAPVRSGVITCMYPTSIGTNHMRCKGIPPAQVKCFTEYLRTAGYYCTNNSKTDYQFASPVTAWDESSNKAHWRNRPEDKPFFSVINLTVTHESQIRNNSKKMLERLDKLNPKERHEPADAKVPPYYPDTDVVRKDWAQYYDLITLMDKQVGDILGQLEEDDLSEDTIVWFWSDHGRGLPRAKRWIYDSGIHVPLIIRVPEKYRRWIDKHHPENFAAGTINENMVSSIDFGTTVISLAGVGIPQHMQGRAFLGPQKVGGRECIFAARDRMDEAIDCIRAVRNKRFKYIRNFMPHVSYGQDIDYMNQMPTMREMRRLNAQGKLKGAQRHYFLLQKPVEELYDIISDPHEINNLADNSEYEDVLRQMKQKLYDWMIEVCDTGLIPEPDFDSIKRPDDIFEKTSAPGVKVLGKSHKNESCEVELSCDTGGASIAYRIESNDDKRPVWHLYTKAVTIRSGERLKAKCFRLGFSDSKVVEFKYGDISIAAEKAQEKTHWSRHISKALVRRLLEVKEMDYPSGKLLGRYLHLLGDKESSVRYWAVIGLDNICQDGLDSFLEDNSDFVRIAAAEALCQGGKEDKALRVLIEALQNGNNSGRLYAATALGRIGQKAEDAAEQLSKSLKDRDEYVRRASTHALARLGYKTDEDKNDN
jgi:N-sulfoglucosamine sulfohydrolase